MFQLLTVPLIFVILSQNNKYFSEKAEALKIDIFQQAKDVLTEPPLVYLTHEDFNFEGSWTIFPLLKDLAKVPSINHSWIMFLDEATRINLTNLCSFLKTKPLQNDTFLGNALQDEEPTIIHHFHQEKLFKYPLLSPGFILNGPLIQKLSSKPVPLNDFNIDSVFEFAFFIKKETGVTLENVKEFCIDFQRNCFSYTTKFKPCGVANSKLYFAVKTCKKFHENRVPVVKKTWGKFARKIRFFSDEKNQEIPTILLETPNSQRGHCKKTWEILKLVFKEIQQSEINWVIITDDDTILSVSRIQNFLSCFDPSKPILLGERYGFNSHKNGYNYITGGGGMVLSRDLLEKLVLNQNICRCPEDTTPDDMFLAICVKKLQGNIVHSNLFHQARPKDYARKYLLLDKAISFHKHWLINPIKIYEDLFGKEDSSLDKTFRDEL